MSVKNEPVTPAPFEAAQPAAPDPGGKAPPGPPRWVWPTLLGLVLLAAVVVFWLPSQVGTRGGPPPATAIPAAERPAGPGGDSAAQRGNQSATPEASPWTDAQIAKLRKAAQDALEELLELQAVLEERAVEQWAAEAFAAAAATATAADELYRKREFEAATAGYLDSRDQLQGLLDSIPDRVDTELERALAAIEAGDAGAATAALQQAELMEPENARLGELRGRAEKLPQLLALLQQAADAEEAGDLAAAENALRAAAELDPRHRRAAAELQRIAAAHLTQQFNDAMSTGYRALDDARFNDADTAFRRAEQLQPGSTEAAAARRETDSARAAHRLTTLQSSGREHEAQEQWQEAVDAYEAALKIDANILFARDGLERSRERAALDRQFRQAIDQPQRLSDTAVADLVEQLLVKARRISPRGPVLAQQIDQLGRLLQQARTPITVTLRSDTKTDVTLYKVKRLGRFEQQQMSLRPGKYTAVGTRIGYRDVRKTFTVSHDSAPLPVIIACTEPI